MLNIIVLKTTIPTNGVYFGFMYVCLNCECSKLGKSFNLEGLNACPIWIIVLMAPQWSRCGAFSWQLSRSILGEYGPHYDVDVGDDDFIMVAIINISRGRMMNWKSVKWIKNWCLILRRIYILHLDCLTTSWHSFIRNIGLSVAMRVSKRLKPHQFKILCHFYQVVTLCAHVQSSLHWWKKHHSQRVALDSLGNSCAVCLFAVDWGAPPSQVASW